MPEGVRHRFWRPLIEGALNTDWAEASAYVCLRVIKDSLTGPSGSTNCWHPMTDLSQDAIEPLWRWLHREQARLIRRCRIASIRRHTALSHSSGQGAWQLQAHPSGQDQALTLGLENQAFDAVVLPHLHMKPPACGIRVGLKKLPRSRAPGHWTGEG